MVDHEYRNCEKKVRQLIGEAEEMGEHFSFDLRYERIFESLERNFRYFAEKNLLIDGERRLHQFYIYLRNSERMIELATLHSALNTEGKEILQLMQKVNSYKNERSYADLVHTMFTLKDKLDLYFAERPELLNKNGPEEEQTAEEDRNDIIAKQALIMNSEMVQELAADPEQILKFAYELRKQDIEDKYTLTLIDGQVRPPVLVEIILANKWNSEACKMTVDAKDQYAIMSGDKYLRYSSNISE
jgi:hypothetical protein